MLNKVNKGNRVQLLCKKELEHEGWYTESKTRAKYQSPDFYGLFDILAIKGSTTRLIQVKSNISDFYGARKAIRKWIGETGVTIPCECWCYLGRGDWRQEVIEPIISFEEI